MSLSKFKRSFGSLLIISSLTCAAATFIGCERSEKNVPQSKASVVEIATGVPSLSNFVQSIQSAGLVKELEGPGPFTLFIPDNAAFDKLPLGTLQTLLRPENRKYLQELINFHIVPEKISIENMRSGKVKTLGGKELTIKTNGSNVTVDEAKVIEKGVEGSNGIIYVIDTVLIP